MTWKRSGPSFPLPIATQAWQDIEIDFIPVLPPSGKMKYTRIATVVDRFSGEIKLIPCFDKMNALEFMQLFIDHIWHLQGMPYILQTD